MSERCDRVDLFKAEIAKFAYPLFSNKELAEYVGCSLNWIEKMAQFNGLKKARARCGEGDYGLPIDLEGMTFGKLKVMEKMSYKSKNNTVWLTECECGLQSRIRSSLLVRGIRTDCGSCNGKPRQRLRRGEVGAWWWSKIRAHALERGIPFEIELDYALELYDDQKGKCALSGMPIVFAPSSKELSKATASLDRIDSSIGYIEGNCQWIFKPINLMKNKYDQDEFIRICETVTDYQRELRISKESADINISNPN